MVYPSTFDTGLPGEAGRYRNAIAYPYDVVRKSTERSVERARAVNPEIQVRPWIQDFQDYAFDYRTYTPGEIRAQMDGAREGGGHGWLLWDAAVRYTREALVSAQPAYPPEPGGQSAGNCLSRYLERTAGRAAARPRSYAPTWSGCWPAVTTP